MTKLLSSLILGFSLCAQAGESYGLNEAASTLKSLAENPQIATQDQVRMTFEYLYTSHFGELYQQANKDVKNTATIDSKTWTQVFMSIQNFGLLPRFQQALINNQKMKMIIEEAFENVSECLVTQTNGRNCSDKYEQNTRTQFLNSNMKPLKDPVEFGSLYNEVVQLTNAELLLRSTSLCQLSEQGLKLETIFSYIFTMKRISETLYPTRDTVHRKISDQDDLLKELGQCIPNAEARYFQFYKNKLTSEYPQNCHGTGETSFSCSNLKLKLF